MSRLDTMARFAEPSEPAPVYECDFCERELYRGDTVHKCDSDTYCSAECVKDAYCETTEL